MKLCTFCVDGRVAYGARHDRGGIIDLSRRLPGYPSLLRLVQDQALEQAQAAARGAPADYAVEDIAFLPLFEEAVTVHGIGLNYAAHTAESGRPQPAFPRTFFKSRAALVGHGEDLEMPALSSQFDFEGELAVVIGRPARRVVRREAPQHVLGYTVFMDGSVRDYQLQRTLDQGKNFFRSSAMGPYLVTADEVGDLSGLMLSTYVSGERMQHAALGGMIFPVPVLIEYLSGITRLAPGDVIATGTPDGVGFSRQPPRWLAAGDTVEVAIERVGRLRNRVAA